MKRYQKLILDAAGTSNYSQLAIAIEAPTTSVHEWATHGYKVPQYKSLEKIAAYFKVPLPTLLMEADDPKLLIVDALFKAEEKEVRAVAFMLGIKL